MERDTYDEACWACRKNAERYLEDAKKLIEEGSFGHSLALTIIGQEELSKALIYFLVSQGILEPNEELLEVHMREHPPKIALSKAFVLTETLVPQFDPKQVEQMVKRVASLTKSKQERIKRSLEGVMQIIQNLVGEQVEIDEVERDAAARQRLKERGLYVDIVRNSVTSPEEVSREEAEAELKRLEQSYRTLTEVTEIVLKFSIPERSVIVTFMRQFAVSMILAHQRINGKPSG